MSYSPLLRRSRGCVAAVPLRHLLQFGSYQMVHGVHLERSQCLQQACLSDLPPLLADCDQRSPIGRDGRWRV